MMGLLTWIMTWLFVTGGVCLCYASLRMLWVVITQRHLPVIPGLKPDEQPLFVGSRVIMAALLSALFVAGLLLIVAGFRR